MAQSNLTISQEVNDSWTELTEQKAGSDNAEHINWVLWELDGKQLNLVGKGTGGHSEFLEQLADDKILFGGLKIVGVDERQNVTSHRSKYVVVTWTGESVGALKKARVSVQRGEVMRVCNGLTASLQVSDKDDLSQKEIASALLKAGAAHKPTHYDFGDGNKIPLEELC